MSQVFKSFSQKTSFLKIIRNSIKFRLFRSVTARSANIFLRGSDIISVNPQIQGLHEPELTSFIRHCSDLGYDNFLLDIGANIGLTACQNGSAFKRIVCFEPNPLCVNILKVNVAISLNMSNVEINEFGLGGCNEILDLWVPKHNWGGAFIKSPANAYSERALAVKDGYVDLDINNYLVLPVSIRSASDELKKTFKQLSDNNLKKGVIKIDVEGMELIVLQAISEALSNDINVCIIFENLSGKIDEDLLRSIFHKRKINVGALSTENPYGKNSPLVWKFLSLLFGQRKVSVHTGSFSKNNYTDVALLID